MGVKRKFCWSRMEVLLVRKGTLLNHIGQFREYRWSGRGVYALVGQKRDFLGLKISDMSTSLDRKGSHGAFPYK